MNYLKITREQNIQTIELNRPDVKNAFHPDMIAEITQAFREVSADAKVSAVVLKGTGTAFCAGADLNWMKEMVNYSFEQNIQDSEKLWDMFEAVAFCEVPVIGVVHGVAFGGALGLIACCDQVIADEKTKFCFSEVRLGLSPAVISAFIMRKCADAMIRPYMLNAEVFDAERAKLMGLVHLIQNSEQATLEVKKYLSLGTQAIRETKKLLNNIELVKNQKSWSEQKKLTTTVISQRRMSEEGQTLLKSFLNK